MTYHNYNNVINYPYIDYIIKSYVPELQLNVKKMKWIDMEIFNEAMMHVSTKTNNNNKTYERLEYLGDAVLHMVITEYLYKRYDEDVEGFLTRLRIRIERGDSLAELTKIIQMDHYIQVGKCIIIDDHILEDVFEAFIGAFYINFGIKYTKIFVINLIEKHKNLSELIYHDDNYKGLLLRYFHQMKWGHPEYVDGKYHQTTTKNGSKSTKKSSKKFISIVKTPNGEIIGKGIAITKKKAEQLASYESLIKLGVIVEGDIDLDWEDKIEKIEKLDKKDKNDKNPMPIYNSNNILITKKDIKDILSNYNIGLSKDAKLSIKLYYEAMTHRSYLIRKNIKINKKEAKKYVKLQKKSNERLKFLGGSLIHFIIGDLLFNKYKNADEGFLTRLRCKLENHDFLFKLAKKIEIDTFVLVSQNIEILHGRNNIKIIGGGFEAFIGALYLDLGMETIKSFIHEIFRKELNINKIAKKETNYKDMVLQLYARNNWGKPIYKIIKEQGPDHKKIFTMGIYLNGRLMGKGTASNKKKAEQIASKKMFDAITKKQ